MKRLLFIGAFILAATFSNAQSVPYNVVFDLTSSDTTDHKVLLRWVNEVAGPHPDAHVEVVLYGQSLDMVTQGKSVVAQSLQQALQNKNVSVNVCAIAMKRLNLDKSQLLPGVGVVPDGIYEIISKQKEGWGYIKAAATH